MMQRFPTIRKLSYLICLWSILFASLLPERGIASPLGDEPGPKFQDGKNNLSEMKLDQLTTTDVGESIQPQAAGTPDLYGYTWSDAEPYSWDDISTSGTDVGFNDDDAFSSSIPLGFLFPFYEDTYQEVFISTNGILTFNEGSTNYDNRSIPFLGSPNSFIAPFWDDLEAFAPQDEKIFYKSYSESFVVTWQNVRRFGAGYYDLLTFEAILFKSGNICFQYKDLNGTLDHATVGIEDPSGVDGLTYLYNTQGLSNLESSYRLCFFRPGPHREAKVLPTYQGKLTINRQAEFDVSIRNIGTLGEDRFDLTTQLDDVSWVSGLYTTYGSVLADTNGNGLPDTGPLAMGASTTVRVRLTAPASSLIGANVIATLTAKSAADSNQSRSVQLQSAAPASFAQAVRNSETGVDLDLVWVANQREVTVTPLFTGSNLAVTALLNNGFMYSWEKNENKTIGAENASYTNIEYALLSNAGLLKQPVTKLTNNSDATSLTYQVKDTSPTLATSPSGKVGVSWKREILDSSIAGKDLITSNIFFMIFNPADPFHPIGPINVTKNTIPGEEKDLNIPFHYHPLIKPSGDGNFTLVWEEKRQQTEGKSIDLFHAVYSPTGTLIHGPDVITTSLAGKIQYQESGMSGLSGNRILVAYSQYNVDLKTSQPSYQVFNSTGTKIGEGAIGGVNGEQVRATQLGSGKILLAWNQATGTMTTSSDQVAYAILDGNTYASGSWTTLSTPDNRQSDFISLQTEEHGFGVITWLDADLKRELYYALINSDGSLLTPAVAFKTIGSDKGMVVNDSGYSLASYYGSYLNFLPLTTKN